MLPTDIFDNTPWDKEVPKKTHLELAHHTQIMSKYVQKLSSDINNAMEEFAFVDMPPLEYDNEEIADVPPVEIDDLPPLVDKPSEGEQQKMRKNKKNY